MSLWRGTARKGLKNASEDGSPGGTGSGFSRVACSLGRFARTSMSDSGNGTLLPFPCVLDDWPIAGGGATYGGARAFGILPFAPYGKSSSRGLLGLTGFVERVLAPVLADKTSSDSECGIKGYLISSFEIRGRACRGFVQRAWDVEE